MAAMRPEPETELAHLNRRFRPALMAYFLRRLGNHAEAEDLTQEVFLKLAGADTSGVESTEGYIFRMAGNLLRDRARRLKVRSDSAFEVWSLEGAGVDILDPSRVAADREAVAALLAGLNELAEPTRSIFVLYRLENVDRVAIGQAYGLSRNQVDRHITKAVSFLTVRVRGPA